MVWVKFSEQANFWNGLNHIHLLFAVKMSVKFMRLIYHSLHENVLWKLGPSRVRDQN